VVDVEASVLRFSFAMLTEVAVTRKDEGLGVFVAIVGPLLIEALIFKHGWIFQSMGIEGSGLEDELGDGQDGSDEEDLPPEGRSCVSMPCNQAGNPTSSRQRYSGLFGCSHWTLPSESCLNCNDGAAV
jgi:hypothetical protein